MKRAHRDTALVVGSGIFGVCAALELRARGWTVTMLDPGPVPHPLAASTDVSKAVRLEYGADALYTELGERALRGWRQWNEELGEELFHETGVLFLRPDALAPGTFEGDSLAVLRARGHTPEELAPVALRERFPAWSSAGFGAGLYHAVGGWVESGRVVRALASLAAVRGVECREGDAFSSLEGSLAEGYLARLRSGETLAAQRVLFATGAWTPYVLPELAACFRASALPVFHLRPREPERFAAPRFPVFGADISGSGWYGFPLHPREGVVKVARHSSGTAMHPESPARVVGEAELEQLREFLAQRLPELCDAPVVYTRLCLYCDTLDGDFWIDEDPSRPGVVVAAGGSGHAFKFAPVLGALAADALEGRPREAFRQRFRWRDARAAREQARAG